MKPRTNRRNSKRRAGVLTVELAIISPLLMLMMVGAADFSRVFYNAVEVANASSTAALFGSGSTLRAATYGVITAIAEDDAADLQGVTATPDIFCDCPGNTLGLAGAVSCVDATCEGYGFPRVYSRVTVRQTFEPYIKWPGIPSPVTVARESYVRVQ